MADSEGIETVLRQVTELILDQMQSDGWFLESSRERIFTRPTAWDINCGWCEEWAMLAKEKVGGEIYDLSELGFDPDEFSHVVLLIGGMVYDSENPGGVTSPKDLLLVRGVTRDEFLLG